MAKRFFTKDNPPKSGMAKKLWDWFIDQGRDENGYPNFVPDSLHINTPGFWQRGAGTPRYLIVYNIIDFCIDDPSFVIKHKMPFELWNRNVTALRNVYVDDLLRR